MASTTALPTSSSPTKIILKEAVKNPTQPHTNTITNIASKPNSISTGSLLALNQKYIVYAVKNGLVRVIDRSSELRTLLRGHEGRISDLSFFESTSDVVACVSESHCRIWRVFGREDELSSEILLEIQQDDSGEKKCALERVIWHPFNPNQLVLLHQGSSVATFIETTKLMTTTASEEDGQSHAICQMKNDANVDGMLKLIVIDCESGDSGVCDLSWSNQDARHVLTAHKDGCVRLWDLSSTVYIADGKEVDLESTTNNVETCTVSARCLMTVKVSTDSDAGAQRCFFLQAFDDAWSMFRKGGVTAMEPGSYMTSPFITYSTNGEVALWSPFTMTGSPPSIVRIFKFENTLDAASTNVSVCTLPPVDDEKPPSVFLLLSDTTGSIYALHMASQWRDVPNSNLAPGRKPAASTGFDYMVYFKALQPIYSQTTTTSLDDSSDIKQWNLDLFCVQSKAVQQLTLSPAMCLAPSPLEYTATLPNGIVVEEISKAMTTSLDDEEENIDFQEYEDGDVIDESFEEVVEKTTIEAVPTPPLPGFLGGDDNAGAFSNWLGNLAGVNKPKEAKVEPEETKSDIDLDTVPLPEAPEVEIRSISAPPKATTPELLSPMEILGMAVKKEEKKMPQPMKVAQPVIAKEEKKPTKKTKAPKSTDEKKITILKREDTIAKKIQVQIEPKLPPAENGNSGVTKDEIEQIVRKALTSHIQKHESIITAEIQKAVRYEVQSGLVPALNKTVAQTLDQTVSKTVKAQVSKTVKESMKANAAEIAASISSNIQEPVIDSFHKTMREVVVPAYENGTRRMFEQVSSSIEKSLESSKKESDETAKIMDSMVKRMDAMGKTIEVLIKAVAQLQTGQGGSGQPTSKQSTAPAVDDSELLRKKIVELLRADEYEKAFTQALSVSNSAMALFVCKHSNLSVVLESDTPKISQPIMLCLMQQLGANLATDSDLSVKLAWLQSMALTLDPKDASIKKHISGVVQQLIVNLQSKMQNSDPGLRRHLQMLLQVIRGLMA